jgi:hypothetical protein
MSEVTYYVALPFVAADDRIVPAEAIECFNRRKHAYALAHGLIKEISNVSLSSIETSAA